MQNYWENLFAEKGALWDFYPSDSALIALKIFQENNFNKILIPGVGYGRNAKPFIDAGFIVHGIEISKSAIELAKKNNLDFKTIHGSLLDIPFNNEAYQGVFCHATLHLFTKQEREKILNNCYNLLEQNGLMFFTIVSIDSIKEFKGMSLDKNTIKLENGIEVYFSDLESIINDFGNYNIINISKIAEPIKHMKDQKPLHFFNVICKKN
ncbi:MAG: class I SAM-dependent methyltransferase [Bacteroidales bacterium]|jgi:2-polyprenyl-3-methyl-5-hydroxy-6-metoxy-1,4-benzoquinol methylase|nr:class I SAM-dependent methyltransferase [Bacteroidales bacterium]